MDRRFSVVLPVVALAALAARPARAQVPAGAPFQVNTYTTGSQTYPAVALNSDGSFVVVWHGTNDGGPPFGVGGQRYDARGSRLGGEFPVNTYTTGYNWQVSVAPTRHGGFVVVWENLVFDGEYLFEVSVRGQRFAASGAREGGEFLIDTAITDGAPLPQAPRVASAADGSFVVAWSRSFIDRVFPALARRYDPAGNPIGSDFQVNRGNLPRHLDLAVSAEGSFVAVWRGNDEGSQNYGIAGQRFDAAGAKAGLEFRVNVYTTETQQRPRVAMASGGAFLVAWESRGQDGSDYGVFGRRFDAGGGAVGGEFRVNGYTTGRQWRPAVGSDREGNVLVLWEGPPDGHYFGTYGQRYDAAGNRRGGEFQVNTYTFQGQGQAAAGMDGAGSFVVSFTDLDYGFPSPDGSGAAVFARRYGGLLPSALAVDPTAGGTSDGNGVLEPGESVRLEPSWRNVTGATQAFSGTLTGITGPPGATYTLTDAAGDYGAVADGEARACTDCFGVAVSAPPTRPLQHWDARTIEAITPDAQGQRQPWALHVGDSFADVPRASPSYRYVESLLHHGVTAGCAAASYCPASAVTREQMAVFVLVAREGPRLSPPACTVPVFADVPAASPYCRFIEELVRRGVASGCGGGNYCPGAAVTRDQMAVFLLRTLHPALVPPACTVPMFADVPADNPFCRWIEELARRGVTGGCGGGNYCPAAAVTREQMGVFVAATFSLTLYGG